MSEERGETILFTVGADEAGARLDQVLMPALEDVSRNYLQKLIKEGCVSIDGKPCLVKKTEVKEGMALKVDLPPVKEQEAAPEDIPLEILYEDDELLVVNKPRGMVVHPAPGNETGTLVNALLYHCKNNLSTINGVRRPGIVHRIDKDTSGLLMVAKTDRSHKSLSEQLAAHSITRVYTAIVNSNIKEEEGTVDAPLGRDTRMRLRQAVAKENGKGAALASAKKAVTHYKVLERFGKYTLIQARLETGRTHQIRVHMAHIKHPLLGDALYGPDKNPYGVVGQMLHAGILGFVHPVSGQYMEMRAPLPAYFEEILVRLRAGK